MTRRIHGLRLRPFGQWGLGWVTTALVAAGCGSDGPGPGLSLLDGTTGPGLDAGADAAGPGDDAVVLVDTAAADTVPPEDSSDVQPSDVQVFDVGAEDSASDATTVDVALDDVATPTDTIASDTADASGTVPPDPFLRGPMDFTNEDVEVAGYGAVVYRPTMSALSPAVVLAPGFQVPGPNYAHYAEHLASHGITVLVPTFGDNFLRPISHSDLADDVREMVGWLADQVAVDPERIGAGGHSRGGKVSILAALRDTRIRASFNLDPVDSVGPIGNPTPSNPSVTPELMGDLTIPFGVVGAELGATPAFPGAPPCAPSADNYDAYVAAATSTEPELAVIAGAGHNDFLDPLPIELRLLCKNGDSAAEVRRLTRGWMVAFYRRHLAADARYAPFFP
jgi:hypothetical protein